MGLCFGSEPRGGEGPLKKWREMPLREVMEAVEEAGRRGKGILNDDGGGGGKVDSGKKRKRSSASDPSFPTAASEENRKLKSLLRTIHVDLLRTHPHHPYFKHGDGTTTLRNILMTIAMDAPGGRSLGRDVGYLQGMNYLGGWMLCCFLCGTSTSDDEDEEEEGKIPSWCMKKTPSHVIRSVLLLLSHLTTIILPGYFTPSLPLLMSDTDLITSLVRERDRELYDHLARVGLEMGILVRKRSSHDMFLRLYNSHLLHEFSIGTTVVYSWV